MAADNRVTIKGLFSGFLSGRLWYCGFGAAISGKIERNLYIFIDFNTVFSYDNRQMITDSESVSDERCSLLCGVAMVPGL